MTGNLWYLFDRDAAAVEVLEHALDLFDQGCSLPLVRAVGHSAATYFSGRVRPGGKGSSARFELTDLMKEVMGPTFRVEWFREMGWNVGNALKHHGDETESATVLLSQNSVGFVLMCAIADCRKALGDVTPKMEAWRLRQADRLRVELAQDPTWAANMERIVLAMQAGGERSPRNDDCD